MKKDVLIDSLMLAISAPDSFVAYLCIGALDYIVPFFAAIVASLVASIVAVATHSRAAGFLRNGIVAVSFVLGLLIRSPKHDDGVIMFIGVIVFPTLLAGVALACISTVRLLDE